MKFSWILLAVLAATAAPATAQEQPVAGTDEPAPSTAKDVRALHDYARCVARRRTPAARALLAMDYRAGEQHAAILKITSQSLGCAPRGTSRFNERFFAGRMAEALLRDDLAGAPLASRVALDPARPAIVARDETELMSICTVRAAPEAVNALFATEPASPGEASAVRALMPQIGQCLAAGATAQLNRSAVRSLLALAAYRLSEHNHPSPAGN